MDTLGIDYAMELVRLLRDHDPSLYSSTASWNVKKITDYDDHKMMKWGKAKTHKNPPEPFCSQILRYKLDTDSGALQTVLI